CDGSTLLAGILFLRKSLIVFGILINLTLLNATTTVKWTKDANGNIIWEVYKKEASPELIKPLFAPITELFKRVGIG
ncbi:MAG: hypothetical protein ACOVOV_11345, partial [Dolichospermum sp.]